MWTLLYALGPGESDPPMAADGACREASEAAPGDSAPAAAVLAGPAVETPAAPAEASIPSSKAPASTNGMKPQVQISLWPGGALLGPMELARAAEQFDLAGAERFRSLKEAMLACAHAAGFLVEIPAAVESEAVVLFVKTLRA